MNDKAGTTKLLSVSRAAPSAGSVSGATIAVRFGDASTSIALVDDTDAGRLLIFQVTYADVGSHRASGVDFLAAGEDNDKIQRFLVNRLVPEFVQRLPELADRACIVNYTQLVPKSAQLLFDLAESLESILYQEVEGLSCSQIGEVCTLIDSSEFATTISSVDKRIHSQSVTTKTAADATHKILRECRRSLASLLADDLTENDSADCQLSRMLHNMSLSERPAAFQDAFASCVQPALAAYTALVNAEICQVGRPGADCSAVVICDPIFSSQLCRTSLARSLQAADIPVHKIIRFVKDAGLLGFLGALLSA